jgi:eukaryotic-like serine/threonine-protein kinase
MLGDSVRRRQPKKAASKPGPKKRRAGGTWSWRPLLIALPVALLLPFIVGYALAVYVLFPPQQAAGAGLPVPSLVGGSAAEAQRALVAAGLGSIETTQLPHPSAPAGQVIAQSPLPGQHLPAGANVSVALSAGRPRALVPDVQGFNADRAQTLLRRAGFDVTQATQESPMAAGRALRTEPAAGQDRELPAVVTLVISAGPPPVPEPEPAPLWPDTSLVPAAAPPGRVP